MKARIADKSDAGTDLTCETDLSGTLKAIDTFDAQDRSPLPTEADAPDHKPRALLEIDFGNRHALLYLEALKPTGHDIFLQVSRRKLFGASHVSFSSALSPSPKEDVINVVTSCFEMDTKALLGWAEEQSFLKKSG